MMIVAIVAAVVIPRFVTKSGFESRGFYDQTQAVVRYAQKVAIAQRRVVYVSIGSTRVGVCYDSGCAAHVAPPSGYQAAASANCGNDANWLCAGAPEGNALSPASSFSFDGLGRSNLVAALTVTVSGDMNRPFTVEPETGYVHP